MLKGFKKGLKKRLSVSNILLRHPLMYKLVIRDDDNSEWPLRLLLSLPIGLLMGFLFYTVIASRFSFPIQHEQLLKLGLISTTGISYVMSIQVRAICWLVIPTFTGRTGRSFLFAYLFTTISAGPIYNLLYNTNEGVNTMSCSFRLVLNMTVTKVKVFQKPMMETMENVALHARQINQRNSILRRRVDDIFSVVEKDDLDDEGKNNLRKELKNATQVNEHLRKKMVRHCEKEFDKAVKNCEDGMKDKENMRCAEGKDNVDPASAKECPSWVKTLKPSDCPKVEIKGYTRAEACNESKINIADNFGEEYLKTKEKSKDVQKAFDTTVKYQAKLPEEPIVMTTPDEVAKTLKDSLERKQRFIDWGINIINNLIVVVFLWVFISANSYHNNYLTKIGYDNHYLTHYFRRIDARRRKENKLTLIPLKKNEKCEKVIQVLSLHLRDKEKDYIKGSIPFLTMLVISIMITLLIDWMLGVFLNLITIHCEIKYWDEGVYIIDPTVEGNGTVAFTLRAFVEKLKINHTASPDITSTVPCLPHPILTTSSEWVWIYVYVIAIILLSIIEMFALRWRHVICGYFYRKRDKKRTLHLYNQRLKNRTSFLKYSIDYVRRKVREGELKKEDGIEPGINYDSMIATMLSMVGSKGCLRFLFYGSDRRKCIVCGEAEDTKKMKEINKNKKKTKEKKDLSLKKCPNGCDFVYCNQCWQRCDKNCIVCSEEDQSNELEDDDDSSSDDDSNGHEEENDSSEDEI